MDVFLSPHMDDTTLSCGGLIAQRREAGESVTVINVMAGKAPETLPDSPLVRELHERWNLTGQDPVMARQQEEIQANATLNAHVIFWEIPDCIYRTAGGVVLYPFNEDLFGEIHPLDPAHAMLAQYALPPASHVYVPLGIGGHVDHVLVGEWARRVVEPERLIFYEDYPYAANEAWRQAAFDRLPAQLNPQIIRVNEREFALKYHAMTCYRSQISTFWESDAAMREHLRAYMLEISNDGSLVERYWTQKG